MAGLEGELREHRGLGCLQFLRVFDPHRAEIAERAGIDGEENLGGIGRFVQINPPLYFDLGVAVVGQVIEVEIFEIVVRLFDETVPGVEGPFRPQFRQVHGPGDLDVNVGDLDPGAFVNLQGDIHRPSRAIADFRLDLRVVKTLAAVEILQPLHVVFQVLEPEWGRRAPGRPERRQLDG